MLRNQVFKRALGLISSGLLLAPEAITSSGAGQATESVPFKGTVTVQFTGSHACADGDTNCTTCVHNSGFYIEAQGIADTSLGPLFAKLMKCFRPNEPPYGTYAGTLNTTAPNGKDSLAWVYSGKNDDGGDFYGFGPFSGTLAVKGGTGKFEGARGSATFTAASGPAITATAYPAPPSNFSMQGMAFYYVQGTIEQRNRQ